MRLAIERRTFPFDLNLRVDPLDKHGKVIQTPMERLVDGARFRFRPTEALLKAMGLEADIVTRIASLAPNGPPEVGFSRIRIAYRLSRGPIIEEVWDAMDVGRPDFPLEAYDLATPPIEMEVEMEWLERE